METIPATFIAGALRGRTSRQSRPLRKSVGRGALGSARPGEPEACHRGTEGQTGPQVRSSLMEISQTFSETLDQ